VAVTIGSLAQRVKLRDTRGRLRRRRSPSIAAVPPAPRSSHVQVSDRKIGPRAPAATGERTAVRLGPAPGLGSSVGEARARDRPWRKWSVRLVKVRVV